MTLPRALAGRRSSSRATVERGDERRPARPAGQDALLAGEPPGGRERVSIADPDPAIDDRRVVRARHEILADALGQVRPGGVAARGRDPSGSAPTMTIAGFFVREVPADAGDRAAGPDAGDEVGHPALGLLPDLGAGGPLVGGRVLLVPVLVGLEGAGDVAREARGDRVVGLRRLGRRRSSGRGRPPRRTRAGAPASRSTACRP